MLSFTAITGFPVRERHPLKQGLKQQSTGSSDTDDPKVRERHPLKQGLKL